ncbi:hypothetical protein DERF_000799 [Dermatophagoides farinae]|uniref:Uncharacterized protein n=1 Tax=Dermatophagoides farinae TaxID=6954 RepID=A0A922LAI8_DERFA|nr:hypothetical protein DERF_000799 [Dermatophagoides farinae]
MEPDPCWWTNDAYWSYRYLIAFRLNLFIMITLIMDTTTTSIATSSSNAY